MTGCYYIGLMTGTSMDGVDAALVNFADDKHQLIERHHRVMPENLKQRIRELALGCEGELDKMASLDRQLGLLFSDVVKDLLAIARCDKEEIIAIGSHGQTLRHVPDSSIAYTVQIGDPNTLVAETGIAVVADFRRRDIALGGQGAPFAPIYHQAVFAHDALATAVLNIGGIANLSCLGDELSGFDTGPGNCLMDAYIQRAQNQPFDRNGAWAASGCIDEDLLLHLLSDPFFNKRPPKSTGPDYFNLTWLTNQLAMSSLSLADIQATLCELTAVTIAQALQQAFAECQRLIVCGGGVHNSHLMARLKSHLDLDIISSEALGVCPDHFEAMLFAWLAKQCVEHQSIDMCSVTGANMPYIPGCLYR